MEKPLLIFQRKHLSNNDVFSIVEDNGGNLWFGTRNTGLSKIRWGKFHNIF